MATSAALPPKAPSASGAKPSPLWTFVLGLALIRLVTARRREPFGKVVFGGDGHVRAPQGDRAKSHAGRGAAAERGRGRTADTPTEIPAKGWKDILWRTYEEMNKDRILAVAAGVTYFGILALFPAIAALVSMYGLFADAATINDHLASLGGLLPGGATEIIGEQVTRITSAGGGALGFAFFFGLALSLWSANAGMKAMFDALNVAYGEEEKRSFIKLNLTSLTFTLGAIAFVLLALGGIVVVPVVIEFLGLGEIGEALLSIARWPVLLAIVVLALAVLYRYGPSRDEAQWRWITPGSVLAAVVWIAGSMLFSWYVANFGSYNETYGSLGAAIGFMTWLWLSTTIILVGAELNAEIEHQTAKDTTEGHQQPLGRRGARMADTIGEAKA
jgi:membrane protein